jgi:hypothetical protein
MQVGISNRRADVSRAASFNASLPVSTAAPLDFARREFGFAQLVPVALLSGIGLLASLIAILSGVQIAWY